MSVLAELSIFPMDKGESVGDQVAQVVQLIRQSGLNHRLTAMGTILESDEVQDILDIVQQAQALLKRQGCRRVYATLKLDIRDGPTGRLEGKVDSVNARIDS